ncbi:MAG TPA: hypothetical protein VFF69_02785 [Phycisphaerales bacterium]|nr:hypothetical protein [Phycisphaerales bacterium]
MAQRPNGVYAVVWRAGSVPSDLAGALQRQEIAWEEAVGPFDALSRVLARRAASAQARVLLLVEPESLAGAPEVRGAIERFDPATVCWGYSTAQSPRLSPLAPVRSRAEPEVVVHGRTAGRPAPDLRLAGEGGTAGQGRDVSGQRDGREDGGEVPPRSLLTAEELSMLLADDRE